MEKPDEKHWILKALEYFKQARKIVEDNIKRDEAELREMDKRGRERGLKEPPKIPEGYVDRRKDLKEMIEISKEKLKEYDQTIQDIYKASYFVK